MYNFFNIESPLQLLSAISAARKFDDKKTILLVNLSNRRKSNNEQIMSLVDYDFWDKVIFHKKERGFLKDLKTAKKMLSLKKEFKGKVDKYFFGEYRNFNMALLGGFIEANERVLLDDGSFTITAQNSFIKKNLSPYSRNLRNIIFRNVLKKNSMPNLYSFYKLDLVKGQSNYFDSVDPVDVSIKDKEIYFFGSKFYETKNMSLADELGVIEKVINYYAGYSVFYVPHRDEKNEKLDKISQLNCQIKKLGRPAELYFDEAIEMPEIVVSYFSTTLYTCHMRFSNVRIVSVDVEKNLLKKNSIMSAKYIYQYYKDLGFEILKFD